MIETPRWTSGAVREVVAELPGFVWTTRYEPCVVCGDPTTWVEKQELVRVHPGPCSEQVQDARNWADVFRHLGSDGFKEMMIKMMERRR